MITLQLAQHRKARVWLNELPDARVKSAKFAEHSVPSGKPALERVRRAAVEILIPHGPRALYGLLGAELLSKESGTFVIRVAVSDDGCRPFPGSIALSSDET